MHYYFAREKRHKKQQQQNLFFAEIKKLLFIFPKRIDFLTGRHLREQYIEDMLNVVAGKSTVELCYYYYDTLYYDMLRPLHLWINIIRTHGGGFKIENYDIKANRQTLSMAHLIRVYDFILFFILLFNIKHLSSFPKKKIWQVLPHTFHVKFPIYCCFWNKKNIKKNFFAGSRKLEIVNCESH